jgi:EAL domain-containing protein (putative c-di-GMP-specific phosphodiesterase class I)
MGTYEKVDRRVPAAPHMDEAAPYFQPILALDTRRIVGYEVLGRKVSQGVVQSLGPFFTDARVSVDDQMRIDRHIRRQAFDKLSRTTEQQPMLFVNLKPSWIQKAYARTGELPTLSYLESYKIDPGRIVLEITEDAYVGSMSEFREIVEIYRSKGCRIAIDDVGTGFSSADRIAQIQPDLLKVDIHMMKSSASHSGYLGVLRSFSTLAEQIGASLLIEGIETRDDLLRAIEIGARYVQGYLFAPAEADYRQPDAFSPLVEQGLEEHRRIVRASDAHWRDLGDKLVASMDAGRFPFGRGSLGDAFELSPDDAEWYDGMIERLLPCMPESCIRVYLCRVDGMQLSSNYHYVGGTWTRESEYRGANWSWRPYFLSDLLQLRGASRATVSRPYADLDSRLWIRTISAAVSDKGILFMDIADERIAR